MGKISKALERAEAERLKKLEQAKPETSFLGTEELLETTEELLEATAETSVAVLEPPTVEPALPPRAEAQMDERIVALFDPRSPIAEQYRILRTNLLSLRQEKPIKSILVSSAMHSEGKTVSCVNLAVTLANDVSKRRVLLVDADLRAGSVHQLFGIQPKAGLSDVLAKDLPWQEALVATPLPYLTILPRGITPPQPAELLASPKMRQLVAEFRANYDLCILDSPPIVPLTDPSVLGSLTDGAILVIRAGKTQRTMVQYALSLLTQAHVQVLGCILTHVEGQLPEYIYRYAQ